MTANETLSKLPTEDVKKVSIALAKDIAKRIAVGVVVTVAVTLIANAIVAKIEN